LLFSALQLRQSAHDRSVGSLVLFLETLEQKMGPEAFARMRQESLGKQREMMAKMGVGR